MSSLDDCFMGAASLAMPRLARSQRGGQEFFEGRCQEACIEAEPLKDINLVDVPRRKDVFFIFGIPVTQDFWV